MRFNPDFLNSKDLQVIFTSLGDGNVFAVGGCVRDSIIGRPVNDVDLATSLHPDVVKTRLENIEGVNMIPTGIDHGTWTAIIGKNAFEITTYRRDVATDGRRATVAFANTMQEDAERRDFTMNALYMDRNGVVFDPTGTGIQDLEERRVRFVGDADERCKEDFLRILRLFRFHAQIGKGQLDNLEMDAVMRNARGLRKISGERKWAEIKKILGVQNPFPTLMAMDCTGVLEETMPTHTGIWYVDNLVGAERAAGVSPKWERRYAIMNHGGKIPYPCSRDEARYNELLCKYVNGDPVATAYTSRNADVAVDCFLISNAVNGTLSRPVPHVQIEVALHTMCPVTADDIIKLGVKPGALIGTLLRRANEVFLESDMCATKDTILQVLSDEFMVKAV